MTRIIIGKTYKYHNKVVKVIGRKAAKTDRSEVVELQDLEGHIRPYLAKCFRKDAERLS